MERTLVEIFQVASRTFHPEHLVALAGIDDNGVLHEIGTKGDLSGLEAVLHQEILQQTGIEHDVAMVRDIEITLVAAQLLEAGAAKLGGATCNNLLVDIPHGVVLELADGLERADALTDRL